MAECNATVGTWTTEPCPHNGHCAHRLCLEFGQDRWRHLTLHEIPCVATDGPHVRHIYTEDGAGAHLFWEDGTRGATPHAEPESDKRVTGKMLGDAQNAHQKLVGHYMPHDAMKAVLKAALAAQDTEGNTP
jgi:hypothetical protein